MGRRGSLLGVRVGFLVVFALMVFTLVVLALFFVLAVFVMAIIVMLFILGVFGRMIGFARDCERRKAGERKKGGKKRGCGLVHEIGNSQMVRCFAPITTRAYTRFALSGLPVGTLRTR